MTRQTRKFDHAYFTIGKSRIVRQETVCGDFDAYDGEYDTLSAKWCLVNDSGMQFANLDEIHELIANDPPTDALGLARFFADANDLGDVVSEGYTRFVDFREMFGRETTEMFPTIENDVLIFVARKGVGETLVTDCEYSDVRIALRSLDITRAVLWNGPLSALALNSGALESGE